jgi:hypothetical protein
MSARLYELLERLSFDEPVPTLKKICEKDPRKITGQLPHFKMAFDELRMIEPEINDNTINVGLTESFICVEGCQDYWNTVLGKIINLESGIVLSDSELAVHVLWEITFFGYSEDEIIESIGQEYGDKSPSHDNIYRRKIQEIEDRQWENYSRGAKWESQDGRMLIGYDVFMEVLDRQKRRNRAKRMRDARQDCKIARLRKLANREDIICQAVASGCVSREEIEHILHADSGEEHIYYSRTPTVQGRIEYLEMLMSKYSEIDFSKYDSVAAIVTYSLDYPLSIIDENSLREYIEEKGSPKNLIIRFGEIESLTSHHIKMQLILSKETRINFWSKFGANQ